MKKVLLGSISLTALVILIFSSQTSCKKETITNTVTKTDTVFQCTPSIKGLWIGTYQTDQVSHVPTYYSFVIYPDGTLIIKAKGVPPAQSIAYATGSWTLTNNVFAFRDTTLNYSTQVIQNGTLTYNNTNSMTNGTWQDVSGQNYTGTFPTMAKVE